MPWKSLQEAEARRLFVAARWRGDESMTKLCERFGISRQCGYKWWCRAQKNGAKYQNRRHRTKQAEALSQRWGERVLALRRAYRFAGARQLRWYLQREYRLGPWPGERTIGRWLQAAGMTRKRRRYSPAGRLLTSRATVARVANEVWTLDFKGWFCTRDGKRVCALTVRDLATRYVLLVRHVDRADERQVGTLLRRLFSTHGVPRAIRVDNGPPFGGVGPRGWSTLAVAWVCLGIKVEYGRPACPQDNAEHEQMHQVLHRQTAAPAAATLRAQQRRFDRWRWQYNCDRPNQAIGMQLPCALYQRSDRRPQLLAWSYPPQWLQKYTDPRGRLRWGGDARLVGRAFGRRKVALKPVKQGVVEVYFGPHLLGELHVGDATGIRAVRVQHHPRPTQRGG